jgi:hypothetical protein
LYRDGIRKSPFRRAVIGRVFGFKLHTNLIHALIISNMLAKLRATIY